MGYDEYENYFHWFVGAFVEDFVRKFADFDEVLFRGVRHDGYLPIVENKLFLVAIKDTGWGVSVKLFPQNNPYNAQLPRAQKKFYNMYCDTIKDCLNRLNQNLYFDYISCFL